VLLLGAYPSYCGLGDSKDSFHFGVSLEGRESKGRKKEKEEKVRKISS